MRKPICLPLVVVLVSFYLFIFIFAGCRAPEREVVYIEVQVERGDTLWDIAKKYSPSRKDLRGYIYTVREINGLESAVLMPGQVLLVPVSTPVFS